MARGETRFGGERTSQVLGTGRAVRGGSIGITRQIAQVSLPGATAAVAANYGVFFTAPLININRLNGATPGPVWQISDVRVRFETAGTDGGGASVMLVRVPSGTAKSAGSNCLAAGVNLQGTINTNADAAVNATLANIQLYDGDSLALVPTGTLTAVGGLSATVEMFRIKG